MTAVFHISTKTTSLDISRIAVAVTPGRDEISWLESGFLFIGGFQ